MKFNKNDAGKILMNPCSMTQECDIPHCDMIQEKYVILHEGNKPKRLSEKMKRNEFAKKILAL